MNLNYMKRIVAMIGLALTLQGYVLQPQNSR